MQEPEPETVRRAQRGDEEAFEDLVRLYLADVYRLARHIVGDPHTADDVTQDTFLNAFRALPRFRWRSKFSTWLFRITHNCAIDATRRAARHRRAPPEVVEERGPPDLALRMSLRHAIDSLPVELGRAFTLVEVFGFSYREAATILDWRVGTLKSRMHRARRLLVDALAEEDTGEV